MKDQDKPKEELISELLELRRRNSELEDLVLPRQDTEEMLKKSEERLELALKGADLGLWDYNLQTGEAFINKRRAEMVGYSVDELEPHITSWGRMVHPDDVYKVRDAFNAHVKGDSPLYECEHRLRCKSGEYIWVLARAKVVEHDAAGNPVRITGTSLDITERKRAEEELRQARDELEKRVKERTAELVKANERLAKEITERKNGEEALRESGQLLTTILDASPTGIGHVEHKKLTWGNPAMMELFGLKSEDDYMDKSARTLYPTDREYERVGKIIYDGLKSGGKAETEAKFVRKDGSIFDGNLRLSALDPSQPTKGTIATITDISERKRAEEALRASEEKYRTIVESIEEGYCEVDLAGNIVFCNDSLCKILGYTREELIGTNYVRYTDESSVKELYRVVNRVYTTGAPVRLEEVEIVRKDGTRISVENSVSLVRDSEGKPVGFRGIAIDITDRKRREDLLIRSERLKGVADLASGVAHNFNNLLQIILGHADFALFSMEEGDLNEVRSNLETILHRSRFGAKVVKSLQDFTEVASGRASAEGKVFDLSDTVDQAVELSKPSWKTRPERDGIEIFLNRNLARDCLVEGQESELFEVVVGLIRNAAEAMPDGGEIRITTSVDEKEVLLCVQDNGVGIPKENLGALFDPFWTGKGPQFIGMGLASAVGTVKRHAGEISVDSEEGKGATFTVRLPLARKPVEDTEPPAKPAIDFTLRILVVDDEPLIARLLDKVLTRSGQTVVSAESGKEAIKIFKENPADLVICDLGMPGMDGWEVFGEIRVICKARGLPKPHFVLLTGFSGQALEKEKITESGVDGILDKPLNAAKLLQAVREVVKQG